MGGRYGPRGNQNKLTFSNHLGHLIVLVRHKQTQAQMYLERDPKCY